MRDGEGDYRDRSCRLVGVQAALGADTEIIAGMEVRPMADEKYIKLNDAIDAIHEEWDEVCNYDGSGHELANEMESVIDRVPAADVRPVVLCRDCQGSSCVSAPTDMLKCVILNRYVTPTEFCAWGHKCEDIREVTNER